MRAADSLEDRIYEAAFLPELWPDVLDALARLIDAEGTLLANVSDATVPWIASRGAEPLYAITFRRAGPMTTGARRRWSTHRMQASSATPTT